jgi:hypothetical protein
MMEYRQPRITAHGDRRLGALAPRENIAQLAHTGYIVFSGFEVDLASFGEFVLAHSSRVALDPARAFHGGKVAQKVDAGCAALGLHLENGNSPFRPDLTWFYCERAASRGSQTTVCDGWEVWRRAGAAARRQFEGQEIRYRRRVEEAKWKSLVCHYLGAARPSLTVEDIIVDDILALVKHDPATTIISHADGAITYDFRTPAVHRNLFGDKLVWANSIFGPSYNYEAPQITFGDGREIPAALLDEMRALTDGLTCDLNWQSGDVVMVDNTRVMHGRRAIIDPVRTIYNAQSYLAKALATKQAQ